MMKKNKHDKILIKERPEQIRCGYEDLLKDWTWDLHATLHFPKPLSQEAAESKVRKDFLDVMKKSYGKRIKLAAVFLIKRNSCTGLRHAHVLITSEPYQGENLSYLDDDEIEILERSWDSSCKVTRSNQWDQNTITQYVTKNKNMPINQPYSRSIKNENRNDDDWGLYFYKPNRLKKLRNRLPRGPSGNQTRTLRAPAWSHHRSGKENEDPFPEWEEFKGIFEELAEGIKRKFESMQEGLGSSQD